MKKLISTLNRKQPVLNRKQTVGLLIVTLAIIAGIGIVIGAKSQAKLRDIRLNAAQNEALVEADKVIKQLEDRLQTEREKRDSLLVAFALSEGIKKEEFKKFREEKRADGSHFVELSEDELKKQAEQQQSQK